METPEAKKDYEIPELISLNEIQNTDAVCDAGSAPGAGGECSNGYHAIGCWTGTGP